jgi:hypothetical protein
MISQREHNLIITIDIVIQMNKRKFGFHPYLMLRSLNPCNNNGASHQAYGQKIF